MARIDGGSLVASFLKREGVTHLFTLSGGHAMPIYSGCQDEGIEVVELRHECATGFAADAHARVTGRPGVPVTTAGPGVTNATTAMAEAMTQRRPPLYAEDVKLVQVNSDPTKIGYNAPAAVSIAGGAGGVASQILEAVTRRSDRRRDSGWGMIKHKEIDLQGSFGSSRHEVGLARGMLARGAVQTEPLIPEVIPLEDIRVRGFERLASAPQVVKILVRPCTDEEEQDDIRR